MSEKQTKTPQIKHVLRGRSVFKADPEKIVKVSPYEDLGYTILTDHSTGFIIQKKFTDVVPQIGDEIVFYTIWFSKVVGLELNGKLLYFLDEEDI